MSLFDVNPNDCIRFDVFGPSKTETLKITNISNFSIAYKIRTTASKAYLVRPNQGYLKPDEAIVVTITIQSDLQQEIKHKFMILATEASNCEDLNSWGQIPKEKIYDVKLDVLTGTGRPSVSEAPRKSVLFTDPRSSFGENINTDELNSKIKALESERTMIEGRISQIKMDLASKENRKKTEETVKFSVKELGFYVIGGLILGYFY